jgi:galactose mutarotase-like enzyme
LGSRSDSWERAVLENEHLRVVVLPGRGGDVHAIKHRPTATQLLWHAPWETPAGPAVPEGADFHEWYLGGWQDLLPNGEAPCTVDGVRHEQHGESWRLPWSCARVDETLVLDVALRVLPLRAWRVLRLAGAMLRVEERVENVGREPVRFMWGHHPAWGGDLLEAGCRVELPGGRVHGYGIDLDRTSRLAATGSGDWPRMPGRAGGSVDLSLVPGPEARSHDVALITDLPDGWYALRNPRRGIGVAVRFPREVFRWLWMWQPYGGATAEPFSRGTYALALEPWTSPPCLAKAVERGAEVRLAPGERLEAMLEVTVLDAERTT